MYNYPDYSYQMQPQRNYQQAPPVDERIWVQNATAAESYLLAPNGFVRLWDSSTNRFYEKRADATGRPFAMDVFEYKKITADAPEVTTYSELKNDIAQIYERLELLESKKGATKNAKQSNADDTSV